MAIRFLRDRPPFYWGCESIEEQRNHESDLWNDVYRFLRAKTDATRHVDVQTSVSKIAEKFRDHIQREALSEPSISAAKSAVKRYEEAALEFLSRSDPLIAALKAEFGGATDEILGDPARREEGKRSSIEKINAINNASDAVHAALRLVAPAAFGQWMNIAGGNLNIVKNVEGPPLRKLVEECFWLFERFRPNEATATVGGDFYLLCYAVHALASGQAKEPGSLKSCAERVISTARNRPRP